MIIETSDMTLEQRKLLHESIIREYEVMAKTEGWQRLMVYLDGEIAKTEQAMAKPVDSFALTRDTAAWTVMRSLRHLSFNQAHASKKRLEEIQKEVTAQSTLRTHRPRQLP